MVLQYYRRLSAWLCHFATDSQLSDGHQGAYPCSAAAGTQWLDRRRVGLSANRRARFYKLTPDGRKHLNAEAARYQQVTGAVARIMGFA